MTRPSTPSEWRKHRALHVLLGVGFVVALVGALPGLVLAEEAHRRLNRRGWG